MLHLNYHKPNKYFNERDITYMHKRVERIAFSCNTISFYDIEYFYKNAYFV